MSDENSDIAMRDEIVLRDASLAADHDATRAANDGKSDIDWLPEWYLGKLAALDNAEEAIKQHAKELIARIDHERTALAWRWGAAFRQLVDRALEENKGKKRPAKSVKYLTGRAGYRQSPAKLEVVDEQVAVDWALDHCPDAVKYRVSTTRLKEHVEMTGEVPPGCRHFEPRDFFYPKNPLSRDLPQHYVEALPQRCYHKDCEATATGVVEHHALGWVPTCETHATGVQGEAQP